MDSSSEDMPSCDDGVDAICASDGREFTNGFIAAPFAFEWQQTKFTCCMLARRDILFRLSETVGTALEKSIKVSIVLSK